MYFQIDYFNFFGIENWKVKDRLKEEIQPFHMEKSWKNFQATRKFLASGSLELVALANQTLWLSENMPNQKPCHGHMTFQV